MFFLFCGVLNISLTAHFVIFYISSFLKCHLNLKLNVSTKDFLNLKYEKQFLFPFDRLPIWVLENFGMCRYRKVLRLLITVTITNRN